MPAAYHAVSVLSVEPWLVEPMPDETTKHRSACFSALSRAVVGGTPGRLGFRPGSVDVSVLSVEPWLVEHLYRRRLPRNFLRFSALSRAVVGGTAPGRSPGAPPASFSALSRAVVGGTLCGRLAAMWPLPVSVLSVEPWLVELVPVVTAQWQNVGFSALSRAVVGGTW